MILLLYMFINVHNPVSSHAVNSWVTFMEVEYNFPETEYIQKPYFGQYGYHVADD